MKLERKTIEQRRTCLIAGIEKGIGPKYGIGPFQFQRSCLVSSRNWKWNPSPIPKEIKTLEFSLPQIRHPDPRNSEFQLGI